MATVASVFNTLDGAPRILHATVGEEIIREAVIQMTNAGQGRDALNLLSSLIDSANQLGGAIAAHINNGTTEETANGANSANGESGSAEQAS